MAVLLRRRLDARSHGRPGAHGRRPRRLRPGHGRGRRLRRFLRLAGRLHEISERFFFWKSVGSVSDTFDAGTTFRLSTLSDLLALRFGASVEAALTPMDIESRYHVLDGAIYGLASHGRFAGAFKPASRSPDLAGLYLAGGAAHPGPGMPMVSMSGWIAADALDRDMAAGRLGASPWARA